jgi:hypothetical protein
MNKRERVLKTLQLEEPDIIPIHSLGYESAAGGYRDFINSNEYSQYEKNLLGIGDITEVLWWNADIWQMDPWQKFTSEYYPTPPEYNDALLHITGRVYHPESTPKPGDIYKTYIDGYFKSPEIVHQIWDQYGRPSDFISQNENYSREIWDNYVEQLSPYVYPMAWLTLSMDEALFEGMTVGRLGYYMRKQPDFIHELMEEFCKTNLEIVELFAEAGVEVVFYSDDLGQRQRSILSLENFRTFVLPYYQRLYDACHKHGMYIVQHSCGYVDEFLPDLADAGLSCIQALEPTAGVNLAELKEKLGDKIAFMGGMDSSRALCFGSPQDVMEDVKKCIKAAGKGGGYFAGLSHTVLDAPWENILAFRDAVEKYRNYPLKL